MSVSARSLNDANTSRNVRLIVCSPVAGCSWQSARRRGMSSSNICINAWLAPAIPLAECCSSLPAAATNRAWIWLCRVLATCSRKESISRMAPWAVSADCSASSHACPTSDSQCRICRRALSRRAITSAITSAFANQKITAPTSPTPAETKYSQAPVTTAELTSATSVMNHTLSWRTTDSNKATTSAQITPSNRLPAPAPSSAITTVVNIPSPTAARAATLNSAAATTSGGRG